MKFSQAEFNRMNSLKNQVMITSDEEDWEITEGSAPKSSVDTVSANGLVDIEWIKSVFPTKTETKQQAWLSILLDNEFDRLDLLKNLDEPGWGKLGLPLGVIQEIKSNLALKSQTMHTNIRPITQVDCIVIDISSSMRARSRIDVDKTREDVSKMLFHVLVDKFISLELSHAVGILAFGEQLTPIGITREYEKFHDELGRLDANQNSTKLYDSIFSAAGMIDSYISTHGLGT